MKEREQAAQSLLSSRGPSEIHYLPFVHGNPPFILYDMNIFIQFEFIQLLSALCLFKERELQTELFHPSSRKDLPRILELWGKVGLLWKMSSRFWRSDRI